MSKSSNNNYVFTNLNDYICKKHKEVDREELDKIKNKYEKNLYNKSNNINGNKFKLVKIELCNVFNFF